MGMALFYSRTGRTGEGINRRGLRVESLEDVPPRGLVTRSAARREALRDGESMCAIDVPAVLELRADLDD